jgi:hypothetical protein
MELDTETLLRIVAVVIAASLLFSSINYSKIVTLVTDLIPMPKPKPEVVPTVPEVEEVTFLEIVDSWHTLRNQCEAYGLTEAVEKIDEVFPLLNTED